MIRGSGGEDPTSVDLEAAVDEAFFTQPTLMPDPCRGRQVGDDAFATCGGDGDVVDVGVVRRGAEVDPGVAAIE